MNTSTVGLVAVLAGLFARPIAAQQQIWKHGETTVGAQFGQQVIALGDLDGDGVNDLLATAPYITVTYQFEGEVVALSGKDGSILYQIHGTQKNMLFGSSLARLSDLDGDGIRDFLVGYSDPGTMQNVLSARSGANGAAIWERRDPWGAVSGVYATLGDQDGDGFDDVVVRGGNEMILLSGKDGGELLRIAAPANSYSFGSAVGTGGDVDGDGVPDLIVSDVYFKTPKVKTGAAWVFSGKTGQQLYEIDGRGKDDQMGYRVAILGDLDGDGQAEFGATAPYDSRPYPGTGWVEVHSGKDGSLLYWFAPGFPNYARGFGVSLGSVGDVNQDGFDEIVIGADAGDLASAGTAFLYSGRDGRLLYHYVNTSDGTSLPGALGRSFAELGDVDGDGRPDIAFSDTLESFATFAHEGSVSVWRTRQLMTDMTPRIVTPYASFVLQAGQETSGQPFAIALVDVGGTPLFVVVAVGTLDTTGRGYLSGFYPYGLSGMTFGLESFAIDAGGHLIHSDVETVVFQ